MFYTRQFVVFVDITNGIIRNIVAVLSVDKIQKIYIESIQMESTNRMLVLVDVEVEAELHSQFWLKRGFNWIDQLAFRFSVNNHYHIQILVDDQWTNIGNFIVIALGRQCACSDSSDIIISSSSSILEDCCLMYGKRCLRYSICCVHSITHTVFIDLWPIHTYAKCTFYLCGKKTRKMFFPCWCTFS